jgi:ABC-type dipeptide/oligopeptide/nickel transport system permease subunit
MRRRFLRDRLAVAGAAIVALIIATAVAAPLLAPADPTHQDLNATLRAPSRQHWLGTDELGRDELSRILYGTRLALTVGLSVAAAGLVVGVVVGTAAGYVGGIWDALLMRVTDVFFAFPFLIAVILLVVVLGPGLWTLIAALAAFGWGIKARLLRARIVEVRDAPYVEAARAVGATGWRVVTRHVLPNSLAPVLVITAINIGGAIAAEAALSFLGLGLPPDSPDWGVMVAAGQPYFGYKNHLWLFPSLALGLTVLGFVLLGDGLRDALDPR